MGGEKRVKNSNGQSSRPGVRVKAGGRPPEEDPSTATDYRGERGGAQKNLPAELR